MRLRRGLTATAALAALATWGARRYPRFRPYTLLLSRASVLPPDARAGVQKWLFKAVYDTMNLLMRRSDVGFLNYGYSPIETGLDPLELPPEIEPDRYSIQLYDKVAGAIDLGGLDVLEVGCGRGGGAAFIFERRGPRTMTGVDLSTSSIAYCRRRYARPGLSFHVADAEKLPFPAASFDAILNVESSHCYPDVERFFTEVARVLRPGGVFLFADLRHTTLATARGGPKVGDVPKLREEIEAAGLVVVGEQDITANVVRALELDSPRRRELIERTAPRPLRAQLLDFAGVEGSGLHRALVAGQVTYLCMTLRPAADAVEPAAA